MQRPLTITLPYPPSVNHYKRPGRLSQTKGGKWYQPRVNTIETTTYFYEVWVAVSKIRPPERPIFAADAIVSICADLYAPDNRKRDIDNPCKVLLDSLVHAKLIADDSQITRLLLTKMGTIDKGKVVLTIAQTGTKNVSLAGNAT